MGDLGAIITCANFTKFLRLTIQNVIAWDGHIHDMIKKLNTASYMIRNVKQMVSMKTLKSVYFAYFNYLKLF
jgi:hypothetical protein